jgi:hypothetical protein
MLAEEGCGGHEAKYLYVFTLYAINRHEVPKDAPHLTKRSGHSRNSDAGCRKSRLVGAKSLTLSVFSGRNRPPHVSTPNRLQLLPQLTRYLRPPDIVLHYCSKIPFGKGEDVTP